MTVKYRSALATAALAAAIVTGGAFQASAQRVSGTPNRSVYAMPPAEGAVAWGPQDNCSYVFQNGQWYRQDICRRMQGPSVYVTYRLSSGQQLGYFDESEPGWVKARDLTAANSYLFALPTVAGRNIQVMINNQWVDLTRLQQLAAGQSAPSGSRSAVESQILTNEMLRQARLAQERREAEAREAEDRAHWDEKYQQKRRTERSYDDKRIEDERIRKQQIEKARLEREAIARAQANRDNQRALDDRAAAQRAAQRAADEAAAYRRAAQRAEDDRAAAERARNR